MQDKFRIAFISGKLGDVDGVSLEVDKWIDILLELGHEVFTIAGRYATQLGAIPKENQLLCDKIRFGSPEQNYYEELVFPHMSKRPPNLTKEQKTEINNKLIAEGNDVAAIIYEYIQDYNIDVIIGQNTNAMPMSLLAGVGIFKLSTEKRVATIFHHHDFWWERSRFSNSHIDKLLNQIMPPTDLGIEHVVISSYAKHILSSIKRVSPLIVPNCEDFDNPISKDEYNSSFREDLGFKEDDILIVQPTRIVPRKRIEDSIELVYRFVKMYPDLKDKVHYIISLYQGDEPDNNYIEEIKRLSDEKEIKLHLIAHRVASVRQKDNDGRKMFTNRDVLANADIVTYLPIWEGFGNALLEAIAAKVPVAVTTYLVYKTDIKGCGFNNIEVRDVYDDNGNLVITEKPLKQMYKVLTNSEYREAMVEWNYKVGKQEFGFETLKRKLSFLIDDYADEIRASRKRLEKSKRAYSV